MRILLIPLDLESARWPSLSQAINESVVVVFILSPNLGSPNSKVSDSLAARRIQNRLIFFV